MAPKVSLRERARAGVFEKWPELRCSVKICGKQPRVGRAEVDKRRAICGTGAQSNLFVHTPAEPDQNKIDTLGLVLECKYGGGGGTIYCREVLQEQIYLMGHCTGRNMKL